MDENFQKELFSMAYIRAVAAHVGYQVTIPEVDDDSVDGVLMADFGKRPRIEFQAKATSSDILKDGYVKFPLKIKNYDDLRADTRTPRILIVVLVPESNPDWLSQTPQELCLRYCAYWHSLKGEPEEANTSSVTVSIPEANMFGSAQLSDMMARAERGDQP